jgi:site-specific recombinase XerD
MSGHLKQHFDNLVNLPLPGQLDSSPLMNIPGGTMLTNYENYLSGSGKSAGTVEKRIHAIKMLEREMGDLLRLDAQDLDDYMAGKMGKASPEYRKSIRASIQSFYRWATTRGLIERDPAYEMPVVKVPRPLPRPVDEDAFEFAYYASEDEARAMILLGGMGGLRLSEITHLHMDNREGNLLRVTGKGNKERIVPMNAMLVAALDGIENAGRYGYYFANPYRSFEPWSIGYVADQIKKHLPKKYSAHNLRHRAASVAYGATKDIRSVQEFLGHSNVNTTQIYTAVTSDALKAVGEATSLRATFPNIEVAKAA